MTWDGSNYWLINGVSTKPHENGLMDQTIGGVWNTYSSNDLYFKVYVESGFISSILII